jgi:hypothetical protein
LIDRDRSSDLGDGDLGCQGAGAILVEVEAGDSLLKGSLVRIHCRRGGDIPQGSEGDESLAVLSVGSSYVVGS